MITDHDTAIATVDEIAVLQDAMAVTGKRLFELRRDITDYMAAENAKRLPHATLDVTLKPGATVYDANAVRAALGELLEPGELAQLVHDSTTCGACKGTGKRGPVVDGTQANKIRRYGETYATALDSAIVTVGDPTVTVKRKEETK